MQGARFFDIAHGDGLGWGVNFMGSVPIIKDQLAVSASYSRRDTPGYIDNILTGRGRCERRGAEGRPPRPPVAARPTISRCSSLRFRQKTDSDNFGVVYEGP